jgi:hypothetical protein
MSDSYLLCTKNTRVLFSTKYSYAQAQNLCKAIDLSACKFEAFPKFEGVTGSMVTLPFLYFDAIVPYLKDKATV